MGCRIGRGETKGKKLPNKKVLAYTPKEMTKCGPSASSSLPGQRIDYCNPNRSDITFRSALARGGQGGGRERRGSGGERGRGTDKEGRERDC